jgi:predicted nucleic acid-binding protein
MPRSTFIDTSGWYALIDRQDPHHAAVASGIAELVRTRTRLVTTDYVIDESCTLAKARSGSSMAFRLLDVLRGTAALDLEWIGAERFDRSEAAFRGYDDQAYSFTDCTSFTLMRELGITDVVTTDQHFRIAGFTVLPDSR